MVKFLNEVLNTKDFPLTVMDRPIESETAKIVENSYRATILAFLDEWSLFAERNGVDLIKVIKAIKIRPTHSNMIFPGPGIGGYCLPKDGGLGAWAYKHILGFEDDIFSITTAAIDINDTRALHVAELTRDALRNMGGSSRARACCCAAPATARTWATPATAARSWWCASSPRWAPRCACTTPTWSTGTSWRPRTPIRRPGTRWRGSSATSKTCPTAGAERPGRGPAGRGGGHAGGAALALSDSGARPGGAVGRRRRWRWWTASASWTTPRSAATSSWAARSRPWAAATSSASRKRCAGGAEPPSSVLMPPPSDADVEVSPSPRTGSAGRRSAPRSGPPLRSWRP